MIVKQLEMMKWNMKIYVVKATEIIKKEEKNNKGQMGEIQDKQMVDLNQLYW